MDNLNPIQWALRPLKKYATFSGRASRAEFWWFFLFVMVIFVGMYFVLLGSVFGAAMSQTEPSAGLIGAVGIVGIIMLLFWLGLIIPTIAVQVRRLHDTNRSGWWIGGYYLLYLVYMVMLFGSMGSMMGSVASSDPTAPPQVNGPMFTFTMILGLLMFVYAIVVLVFFCLPGTKGDNLYGPDPYGADVGEVFA